MPTELMHRCALPSDTGEANGGDSGPPENTDCGTPDITRLLVTTTSTLHTFLLIRRVTTRIADIPSCGQRRGVGQRAQQMTESPS